MSELDCRTCQGDGCRACDPTNESGNVIDSKMVTVCDNCFRACCWQGYFMCDDNFNAGTTEKPISELQELKKEHPHYWEDKYAGDQS